MELRRNQIFFYIKNKNSIYGILLSLYKHGKYYKIENIHLIKQKRISNDINKQN
jgi:hypothetical protein